MINLKKKMILLGALVASMALAACGGSNNGGDDASNGSSGSSKAEAVDSIPEEPNEDDLPADASLPKFTATFNYGEGKTPVTYQVTQDRKIPKPDDPVAPAGKKFYGWMQENSGGKIWNFNRQLLNSIKADTTFTPYFIDESLKEQTFEAEYCPIIIEANDGKGLHGLTYSGGADGRQLISTDPRNEVSASHKVGAKYANGKKYLQGAYVHYFYVNGSSLIWEIESDVAVDNALIALRFGAEYGDPDETTGERFYSINKDLFPVKVNDETLDYGTITFRNIPDVGKLLPFQDFVVNTPISLKAGKNTIEMIVDNNVAIRSAISSTAPTIDAIRIFSSSNLTWPTESLVNMEKF